MVDKNGTRFENDFLSLAVCRITTTANLSSRVKFFMR